MKRKIKNPYPSDQYKCFACSPSNPIGLKLTFEEDEEYVWAKWLPDINFQGYNNVVHGGIIATLLDEIGAWYVAVKIGTAGVTQNLNIDYLKPLYLTKGPVSIRAKLLDKIKNNARMECEVFDSGDNLCARAISTFFLYPEEIAIRRYHYPGKGAF